jgi:hypothetical protein
MVNVRRLAAVDLSGLGPKVIIPEFATAVLGAAALGALTLFRSASLAETTFGIALIGIGTNYLPLLIHAVDLVRHTTVETAIAEEASDRRALFAKYRRQSLWLLVPFAVALAALAQLRHDTSSLAEKRP